MNQIANTKKKAYIEYPIPIECNLKCKKCFHAPKWALEKKGNGEEYNDKYRKVAPFTHEQFVKWRDKWLGDHEEFLVELQGGECSHPHVQPIIFEIFETLGKHGKTKFQIQSNGVGDEEFYKKLIKYKDLIDRIGFTYHRDELNDRVSRTDKQCQHLNESFSRNADIIIRSGIQFYVKEILLPQHKKAILEHKKYWEEKGVEFRMQDFKGIAGRMGVNYSLDDLKLLHPEYTHLHSTCGCRQLYGEYTNIIVRGYDYFAGDVIACWHNPIAVGNIPDDWYKGGYIIKRNLNDSIDILYDDEPSNEYVSNVTERREGNNIMNDKKIDEVVNVEIDPSNLMNTTTDLYDAYKRQHEMVVAQIQSIDEKVLRLNQEKNPLVERAFSLRGAMEGLSMVLQAGERMGLAADKVRKKDDDLLPVKKSLKDQI